MSHFDALRINQKLKVVKTNLKLLFNIYVESSERSQTDIRLFLWSCGLFWSSSVVCLADVVVVSLLTVCVAVKTPRDKTVCGHTSSKTPELIKHFICFSSRPQFFWRSGNKTSGRWLDSRQSGLVEISVTFGRWLVVISHPACTSPAWPRIRPEPSPLPCSPLARLIKRHVLIRRIWWGSPWWF